MNNELKPCPFCGNEAALCQLNHELDTWYAACTRCGAYNGDKGRDVVVAKWNARTAQDELNKASAIIVQCSAEIEQLKRDLEAAKAKQAGE